MMCFQDRSFCASPNCNNDCGRQLTDDLRRRAIDAGAFVALGYFCDKPDNNKSSILVDLTPPIPEEITIIDGVIEVVGDE